MNGIDDGHDCRCGAASAGTAATATAEGSAAAFVAAVTDRAESVTINLSQRLRRIEGQVKGINDMVLSGRYCDDILTQLAAASSALASVRNIVLENHMKTCITKRIKDGDNAAVEELMNTLRRII